MSKAVAPQISQEALISMLQSISLTDRGTTQILSAFTSTTGQQAFLRQHKFKGGYSRCPSMFIHETQDYAKWIVQRHFEKIKELQTREGFRQHGFDVKSIDICAKQNDNVVRQHVKFR